MGAPKTMHRRDDEGTRQHRAFLLYAMQDPEKRSLRATSRAIGSSDNTARKWRKMFEWEARIVDPEHCRHACDLFAELYHKQLGGRDVKVLEERLGAEYKPPGHRDKSEIARSVDLYEQVDRESAVAAFQRDAQVRNGRLRKVLDGTLARVGQGLADGSIKPKPSDIGTVVRGYELMERSEQRRLAMLPSSEGAERSDPVSTSQRVLQAQDRGGDVLGAMLEDTEELLLILQTLKAHESESNVIRLDAARAAKATG